METQFLKNKRAKAIAEVKEVLSHGSFNHKDLESLMRLLSFAAQIGKPGRVFLP